jgi:outer membrane scaffolding protein for murein synthesis (MipA/OmpV family)
MGVPALSPTATGQDIIDDSGKTSEAHLAKPKNGLPAGGKALNYNAAEVLLQRFEGEEEQHGIAYEDGDDDDDDDDQEFSMVRKLSSMVLGMADLNNGTLSSEATPAKGANVSYTFYRPLPNSYKLQLKALEAAATRRAQLQEEILVARRGKFRNEAEMWRLKLKQMEERKTAAPDTENATNGSYWSTMRKNLGAATTSLDAVNAEGVSESADAALTDASALDKTDDQPEPEREESAQEDNAEEEEEEEEEEAAAEEEETFFSLKRLSNVLEMASSLLADIGDASSDTVTRRTVGKDSYSFEAPASRHANTYSRPLPNSQEITEQWGLQQLGAGEGSGGSLSAGLSTIVEDNAAPAGGDSSDTDDDDGSFFSTKRLSQAMFGVAEGVATDETAARENTAAAADDVTGTATDGSAEATQGGDSGDTDDDDGSFFSTKRLSQAMFGVAEGVATDETAVRENTAAAGQGGLGGLEGHLSPVLSNPSPPSSKWKRRLCRSPTFHLPNCRHSQNYYRPLPNSFEIAEQRAAEAEAAEIDRIAMQGGDGSPITNISADDDGDFLSLRKLSMLVGISVDDNKALQAAEAAGKSSGGEDGGEDGSSGEEDGGEDGKEGEMDTTAEGVMTEEELHLMRQREGSVASVHLDVVEGEEANNLTLTSSLRRLSMLMGLAPERHASSTSPLPFEGASMASLRLSLAECVELLVQRRAEVEAYESVMVQKLLDVGFDEGDALATVQIKLAEATNSGLNVESFE